MVGHNIYIHKWSEWILETVSKPYWSTQDVAIFRDFKSLSRKEAAPDKTNLELDKFLMTNVSTQMNATNYLSFEIADYLMRFAT